MSLLLRRACGAIVISVVAMASPGLRAANPVEALSAKVTVEREVKLPLRGMLELLSDRAGVKFQIDAEAFRLAGQERAIDTPIILRAVKEIELFVLVRQVLAQAKAVYRMEAAQIIISPAAQATISASARALIATGRSELQATTPARRIAAAHMLAELGPQARPACGDLCRAMLDPQQRVRRAAADALIKVDKSLGELAGSIVLGDNLTGVQQALALGHQAEPLLPLIVDLTRRISGQVRGSSFSVTVTPKFRFKKGENPLVTCLIALGILVERPDLDLFLLITQLVSFSEKNYAPDGANSGAAEQSLVRHMAILVLGTYGKPPPVYPPDLEPGAADSAKRSWQKRREEAEQAVAKAVHAAVTALLRGTEDDQPFANRFEAIRQLPNVADEHTARDIRKALEGFRTSAVAELRQAAEESLEKMKPR